MISFVLDRMLDKNTRVEKFQAVVFGEIEPNVEVRLKELWRDRG